MGVDTVRLAADQDGLETTIRTRRLGRRCTPFVTVLSGSQTQETLSRNRSNRASTVVPCGDVCIRTKSAS